MSDELIVTLRAEEGNKPGQPIASYTPSRRERYLVFLPGNAKVGENVRVRLVDTGKKDSRGCTLYRGEPAPVEYTERWKDNADGTASRVTISTNWLFAESEEGVLETRALAQREGSFSTQSNLKVVWGQDLASSIIEDHQIRLIRLEEEEVQGGQLVWVKTGERQETLPAQSYHVSQVQVESCEWLSKHLQPIYDPGWDVTLTVVFGLEGRIRYSTPWSQMPSAWRVEQDARYPICSCGRQRRDMQASDSYGKCETCRGKEHCTRCSKQAKVTLTGGNLVCDACLPFEEQEQLIARMLTADHKSAIAAEARRLRLGEAFAREEGMVVLRVTTDHFSSSWSRNGFLQKCGDHAWFYFCKDGIYGSRISPAGLQVLECLPQAAGNGLVELVTWVATAGLHFVSTQIEGRNIAPRLTESELQQLVAKLQASQPVVSDWLRGSEQDRVAALNAKAHLAQLADEHPELQSVLREVESLLQSEEQDYRMIIRRAVELEREARARRQAQEDAECAERGELATILEVAGHDLSSARGIQAFAETVAEILGVPQAIEVLRRESEAPYGRARQQSAIMDQVPGIQDTEIGSRFCGFGRARDVDAWLAGALAWLKSSQAAEIVPSSKPATGGTFTETGNRWFKCPQGHTTRVDKGDWRRYEQGEALTLTCSLCGAKGEVKKNEVEGKE